MFKISVIVPVYNTGQYLEKCLDSLMGQTLQDIQIIVVNDGSTDNSAAIAREYSSRIPGRFVYLEKENSGQADARNLGLKYAAGEYTGFVDSDDYIDLQMYEKLYAKARELSADMAECEYYHVYQKRQTIKKIPDYSAEEMSVFTKSSVCNKLFRTALLAAAQTTFPPRLKYEDLEFVCKIAPWIKKAGLVHERLYYYIQRGNSTMHTVRHIPDIFQVLLNVIGYYKNNHFFEQYKARLEYICIYQLLGSNFFRIIKIPGGIQRASLLKQNWNFLRELFPQWRKNRFLKTKSGLLNMFFKTQFSMTYTMYSVILGNFYRAISIFRSVL
jgi:glycosyltransferase involved in cell wall biosynthesis